MSGLNGVPTSPSNRTWLRQAALWGWREGRRKGSEVILHAPPVNKHMKNRTVEMKTGDASDRNSDRNVKELVDLTCAGDRVMFWHGPSTTWTQMAEAAWETLEQEKYERSHPPMSKAPTAPPAAAPEQKQETPPVKKAKWGTVGAHKVVVEDIIKGEVRAGRGDVITVDTVAVQYDPDRRMDARFRMSVASIMGRLPILERHEGRRGIYRYIGPDLSPRPVPTPIQDPPLPPAEAPPVVETAAVAPIPVTPTITYVPLPEPPKPEPQDPEQVVTTVLDLLFPDGFKASALPAIMQWREATLALMKEAQR